MFSWLKDHHLLKHCLEVVSLKTAVLAVGTTIYLHPWNFLVHTKFDLIPQSIVNYPKTNGVSGYYNNYITIYTTYLSLVVSNLKSASNFLCDGLREGICWNSTHSPASPSSPYLSWMSCSTWFLTVPSYFTITDSMALIRRRWMYPEETGDFLKSLSRLIKPPPFFYPILYPY